MGDLWETLENTPQGGPPSEVRKQEAGLCTQKPCGFSLGSLTPQHVPGKTGEHIPAAAEIPPVTTICSQKPSGSSRMVNSRVRGLSTDSVCYPPFPHPRDRMDVNITQKDISTCTRALKATSET